MSANLPPDPTPFYFPGNSVGVLLIHGFTGSPSEMRLIGEYLHTKQLTISGVCLPGHGTSVDDLGQSKWTDWTVHVEKALTELQAKCDVVFVVGLSLGAVLTLYLAAHNPQLAGVVLYSPAIKLKDRRIYLLVAMKYLVRQIPKGNNGFYTDAKASRRLWKYDTISSFGIHELLKIIRYVNRILPRVSCPIHIFQSTIDPTIHPDSAQIIISSVTSTERDVTLLHNSGHVITVDSEWEYVAEETYGSSRITYPQKQPATDFNRLPLF